MKTKFLEDKRLSIILFAFIFVMYAFVYMTKTCFSAAMASIVSEGVMTKSQTGLISAMFYLVYAPFQIFGGKLADKFPPDKLIIIGLVGSGAVNLAIFFNQNYIFMLCLWTFNAVIQFGVWPAIFKIVSSQLKESHRPMAVFAMSFASSCGMFLAYLFAMFMARWQDNFLFSAISLFVLAAGMAVVYSVASRRMVEGQKRSITIPEHITKTHKKETHKMFLKCGLYAMFPVILFRTVISQGSNTLAPTMLMESYDNVSASYGNFLSLFVIVAGMVGTVLGGFVYTRFIKDEIKGFIYAFALSLPVAFGLVFIGKVPMIAAVVLLALTAMITLATNLFVSYIAMAFARHGKNGEVAGITNAAASLGIMVQTYGLAAIADNFGWSAVSWVWVILLSLSLVILAFVYPRWQKFKKEH